MVYIFFIRLMNSTFDFRNITTLEYYQICKRLLSDSEIKKQIYSLKLTTRNAYQIEIVESKFSSFDGFDYLRSLSLITFYEDSHAQWNRDLSKLFQLRCFHMIDTIFAVSSYLTKLPMSQMQILTLPTIHSTDLTRINFSSITTLKIFGSHMIYIHDFLTDMTNLKYPHAKVSYSYGTRPYKYDEKMKNLIMNNPSTSLRKLTLRHCKDGFVFVEDLLKRTPNLIVLTLIDYQDENLFNVNQWQSLIQSKLTKLKLFNFTCSFRSHIRHSEVREVFQQLQNEFWLKEHQWCTDCILLKEYSMLYTVPYAYTKYTLESYSEAVFNKTIDYHQNIFDSVKYLKFKFDPIIHKYPYYFPSVTSIELDQCYLNEEYVELLKTMVNLTNLSNLSISSNCQLEQSSVLLKILKQMPNLASLSVDHETLISLLDDDFYQISTLWRTFQNIEELECAIKNRQSIRFILEYLRNLTSMKIHLETITTTVVNSFAWFAEEIAGKLDRKIVVESVLDTKTLSIWISKKK